MINGNAGSGTRIRSWCLYESGNGPDHVAVPSAAIAALPIFSPAARAALFAIQYRRSSA
jgi:hypothetical protein